MSFNRRSVMVCIITCAVLMGVMGIIGFLFLSLFDTTVRIVNDTSNPVRTTLLLNNHDNGKMYLSTLKEIEGGGVGEKNIGIEGFLCVFATIDGVNFSQAIEMEKSAIVDGESEMVEMIVSQMTKEEVAACPWSQDQFGEGVSASIRMPEPRFVH
jgi:hypothetical protein